MPHQPATQKFTGHSSSWPCVEVSRQWLWFEVKHNLAQNCVISAKARIQTHVEIPIIDSGFRRNDASCKQLLTAETRWTRQLLLPLRDKNICVPGLAGVAIRGEHKSLSIR